MVVDGRDGTTAVPAAKQRVLLAALALRAGRVVSFEELAEAAWDEPSPPAARVAVRNYVLRLRRVLGAQGPQVVTQDPGYLLQVGAGEVDVHVFCGLCETGSSLVRSAQWARAAQTLRGALGLWRGTPLADIHSQALRDRWVEHLEQLRLRALTDRIRADLQLGQHERVTGELRLLAAAHPLREELWALLLLALYRAGRQSDALMVYQRARQMLVTELGVEPGSELRRLHQQILAHDPAIDVQAAAAESAAPARAEEPADGDPAHGAPAVPRQLPSSVLGFTGRVRELKILDALLPEAAAAGEAASGGAVVISAIGGIAGIGKTALALHFAHRAAPHFPDGQLYVNLRGFHPSGQPVSPSQAIRDFLDALGVRPDRVPATADARASLYRSLLADKRVLVLLDNARDAAQVRPLLPGSPGCLVLITSRNQFTSLSVTDNARLLQLDLLSDAEATDLLAARLGTEVVTAQPEAVRELTRLCGRLPLALAIAASRAAVHPGFPLAALVAELGGERDLLNTLDASEQASVRAVFSWSYRQLAPAAARVFRLLAIHPGPDTGAAATASLAAIEPSQARTALAELVASGLLTEHAPGRYAFHDLLRSYAAELSGITDSDNDQRAALRRVLDHYLHTANGMAESEWRTLTLGPPEPGVTPETPPGKLSWFDAERKALLRLIQQAAARGLDAHAWQLPWCIAVPLDQRGYWHDWAAAQRTAVAAARRLNDRAGLARARHSLGQACIRLGREAEGKAQLNGALQLYGQLADRSGQAHVHLCFSVISEQHHQIKDAMASTERALDLLGPGVNPYLRATALNNMGWCCAQNGDYVKALSWCEQALALHQELGSRSDEAYVWNTTGYAHHHLGRYALAIECYQRALRLGEGNHYENGRTLTSLGDSYQAAGDAVAARDAWQRALANFETLGHPDAAEVRARLRDTQRLPGRQPGRQVPGSSRCASRPRPSGATPTAGQGARRPRWPSPPSGRWPAP
jgi:DNA-binding SARP family transcriptional activator/Tfp pilus assembly protein PilF